MYVYVISRWTLNLLLGVTAAVLPAQVAETGTGISFRDTIGGDTLLFRRSSAVAMADKAVEVDSCLVDTNRPLFYSTKTRDV